MTVRAATTPRPAASSPPTKRRLSTIAPRAVGLVGLSLHAAVGIWPLLATCLRASAAPAAVLALWWIVLAAVAVTTLRSTPRLTPVLPAIALAIWAAVVLLGAAPPPWNA